MLQNFDGLSTLTHMGFSFFLNLFSCNILQGGKYAADVAASVDREACFIILIAVAFN